MVGFETSPFCSPDELLQGLTYTPKNVKDYGMLVLRSSNIQNGHLVFNDNVYVDCKVDNDHLVHKGDIIICVRNGSSALIGKCAIAERDYNVTWGAFMACVRSDRNEFLYQVFQSDIIQKQIHGKSNATINQITNRDFRELIIPLPPLPEQRAIAAALSDVDGYIAALERLIAKKRNIKNGAMQELLTGKQRLTGFSGEWVEKPLGSLGALLKESINPQLTPDTIYVEYSMPAYDNERIPQSVLGNSMHSNRLRIANNVLLFNKLNVRQRRIWWISLCPKNAICSSEFLPYYSYDTDILFLMQLLGTDQVTSDFEAMSTGTSNSQKRITPNNFLEYKVFLPPTTAEQTAIAVLLSDIDTEIDALTAKLNKVRNTKQGMMHELLTGRIRLVDEQSEIAS